MHIKDNLNFKIRMHKNLSGLEVSELANNGNINDSTKKLQRTVYTTQSSDTDGSTAAANLRRILWESWKSEPRNFFKFMYRYQTSDGTWQELKNMA